MRDVLLCHKLVPEAEEALLLDIADQEGVKDNEEGLEGWTAYQLLHKASEGATTGFEILTLPLDDIVSSLSSRAWSPQIPDQMLQHHPVAHGEPKVVASSG